MYVGFRSVDPTSPDLLSAPPHATLALVLPPLLRVLKVGQHYKVGLELEMPTSYTNRRVGVFMVRVRERTPML